jgi:DNA-binding winged helix-turn-helix (wHTH) protein/tetratricopeptide (TPR) repeat protein
MDSTDLSLSGGVYRFDEFELDTRRRSLVRSGAPVTVSPKAFEVLTYLVENPGRVVSKEELLKAVWPDSYVEEGSLSQQVSQLRKAMGDGAGAIVTIPGRGYQFAAKVEMPAAAVADMGAHARSEEAVTYEARGFEGSASVLVRERTRVRIEESTTEAVPRETWMSVKRRWGVGVAAALLVAGGVAGWQWHRLRGTGAIEQVVVADFVNATGDPAFDRMLRRALEIDLGQSPFMDVLSEREAVSALALMGQKGEEPMTYEVAREVCVRTNRHVLLLGHILSVGQVFLLTLEATDCNSGKTLASAKAEASSKEKVLDALDTVADRVRRGLGESAKSMKTFEVPVEQATTQSLEALKAYSMAQYLGAQGKDETVTIPLYQRAVELDPQFAMAWGALANDYYNSSEQRLASEDYAKAFALSDRASARERLVLRAHYYGEGQNNLEEGIKTYQLWTATYPHDMSPWVNMANQYTQVGEYEAAIAPARQGLQVADRPISYSVLARALMRANRMDEAKAVGQQAIEHKQDGQGLHSTLLLIAYAQHDAAALSAETKWGEANHTGWYGWYFPYLQAREAAVAGRERQAEEWFARSIEVATRENLTEAADDLLIDEATVECEYGMQAQARATLGRMHNQDVKAEDLAAVKVRLGDAAWGERFLAAHAGDAPGATIMTNVSIPLVKAELAVQRGRSQEAVAALEPGRRFDAVDWAIPITRAEAYLAEGQPAMAVDAYLETLTKLGPGVDSPRYPLAQLGLARAYAAEGKKVESAKAYEALFAGWKDADADLPVLVEAKAEYARVAGK